jgi:enoyl-CoA hydratase
LQCHTTSFEIHEVERARLLRLISTDGTNRLTQGCVLALTHAVRQLSAQPMPLVIAGNAKFFSAGADLSEIIVLNGHEAYNFANVGQELMTMIERFPAPVYAAVEGYCMGGGLDMALACRHRIASPHAIFGHRGAALGLVTGWGGTQRLPRLIGKSKSLELFVCAEKVHAAQAFAIGLIDTVKEDPIDYCISHCRI